MILILVAVYGPLLVTEIVKVTSSSTYVVAGVTSLRIPMSTDGTRVSVSVLELLVRSVSVVPAGAVIVAELATLPEAANNTSVDTKIS